jgi:hypothetical protein
VWPPRGICAPNRSKGECPIPIKPDQKACKLEGMLVVWVWCGGSAHVSNVPHPLVKNGPSGGFTHGNVQHWINQGHAPCTKGMHKTKLPMQPGQFWWCEAEITNKFKNLVSAYFPEPTEVINIVTIADNDNATVVMSKLATRSSQKELPQPTLLAALARIL